MSDFQSRLQQAAMRRRQELNRKQAASGGTRKSNKNSSGGFWENELKIKGSSSDGNKKAQTQVLRLIPGEYKIPPHVLTERPDYEEFDTLPCYLHMHHRHKTVPNGDFYGVEVLDTRDWCDGQDLSIYMQEKGDDSINSRIFSYYNVLSLSDWHEVDVEITVKDKETQADKQIKVKRPAQCTGVGCGYCDAGIKKEFARACYICLSPNNEEALNRLESTVGQFCQCGSAQPILLTDVNCSGCGYNFWTASFDANGDLVAALSPEDLQTLYDKFARCPGCDLALQEWSTDPDIPTVYLAESITCNGCGNARRATLYHCDLALKKEGTGTSTRITLDTTKFNVRGFRVRELPADLEEKATVFDFHSQLKTTPAIVGKRVKVAPRDNPFVDEAKGAKSRTPKA